LLKRKNIQQAFKFNKRISLYGTEYVQKYRVQKRIEKEVEEQKIAENAFVPLLERIKRQGHPSQMPKWDFQFHSSLDKYQQTDFRRRLTSLDQKLRVLEKYS